ncbi:MAG: glycoside hydrolase family 92 protein [Saprospiraceae bacterium]|nr:glycoside hydrolase family 92 protein [Saprospiraceae bacterium]
MSKRKRIFYTALYHCLVAPNLYQDVDGRYRGMDLKNHKGDLNNPRYTVFSLWDTYRAAHPLYQLVYPDYNRKFILTFLGQYKSWTTSVWELAGNETFCMIGNHSIPVIADALLQSPQSYTSKEKQDLIEAIEATLFKNEFCSQSIFRTGYISSDQAGESVSKTIENSLDYAAYEKLVEQFGNKDQKDSLIYYSSYYKIYSMNSLDIFKQSKIKCSFLHLILAKSITIIPRPMPINIYLELTTMWLV